MEYFLNFDNFLANFFLFFKIRPENSKMLGITDCKTGAKLVLDGEPFVVTWNQFSKTGRQGGVMKTKLRNLANGVVIEKTFQGSDKIEPADIGFRRAQFLYKSGDDFEFMDQETFETVSLAGEILGNAVNFLVEGAEVDLLFFNGNPINIQLPPKMKFKIEYAEEGARGDTKNNVQKPAKIETGFELKVPLFIGTGDEIIVSTETGEYVERAK